MTLPKVTTRRAFLAAAALQGTAPLLTSGHANAQANTKLNQAQSSKSATPAASRALTRARAELLAYFAAAAPQLLRPAEGVLTHASIAPALPGKQYSTTLWDWDTYWTARGLFQVAAHKGDAALRRQVAEHAIGSFRNFFDYQSDEGRVPILITVRKQDPLGTLAKDRPPSQNQAKPVFAQLALLVANESCSVDWLKPYFDKLLRFHEAWVAGNESATGLLVWGNDVAIGNDNDPTTFGRPFFSSANLLLNCLFYEDLKAAAELAGRLGRPQDQQTLHARATRLGANIQTHCWDKRDRFYYTADVQCVDRRRELIPSSIKPGMDMAWKSIPLRIQTFTGFLPMWSKLATPEQARQLVQANYLADDRFRAKAGVRTLSSLEPMYSLDFSSNPSNWLGPVWIIVNYFVWKALANYGFRKEADDLAAKTIRMLADDLARNGSLNEYYHPETAVAISHKGFMDWNLLVLEMMA